jgi:hypothetical protein
MGLSLTASRLMGAGQARSPGEHLCPTERIEGGVCACSWFAPTRGLPRLDRCDNAGAPKGRPPADLLDSGPRGRLEEVEARFVVRQERRADVADAHALAADLFGCGASAASAGARLVSA